MSNAISDLIAFIPVLQGLNAALSNSGGSDTAASHSLTRHRPATCFTALTTSTSTISRTAPSTPNKAGQMEEDAHWLIKQHQDAVFKVSRTKVEEEPEKMPSLVSSLWGSWSTTTTEVVSEEDEETEVQPIVCEPCSFDQWQGAAKLAEKIEKGDFWGVLVAQREGVVLGRRINDEVEFFEKGMREEYKELREDMKAKGLTVRAFVPQAEGTKYHRPSAKAIMGESDASSEGKGRKLIDACLETLKDTIEELWPDKTCELGVLAELANRKIPILAAVRVHQEGFDVDTVTFKAPFMIRPDTCKVIGKIRDGVPTFSCGEEEAKKFFTSIGKLKVNLFNLDAAKGGEDYQKRCAQKEKKAAKKLRRQMRDVSGPLTPTTTGTGDSACSSPLPSLTASPSTPEDVKERQRAKYLSKRKAQRVKKREAKSQDGSNNNTITVVFNQANEDEEEGRKNGGKQVYDPRKRSRINADDTITGAREVYSLIQLDDRQIIFQRGVVLQLGGDGKEDGPTRRAQVEEMESDEESSIGGGGDGCCEDGAGKRRDSKQEEEPQEIQVALVNDLEGSREVLQQMGGGGREWSLLRWNENGLTQPWPRIIAGIVRRVDDETVAEAQCSKE